MRILLAPDSFKGSLTAPAACAAMALGLARSLPQANVISVPMADGGEGTVQALTAASSGRIEHVTVRGPLGSPTLAAYGILGDGRTAIIEMAAASGLPLVPPDHRDPKLTCTFGTGELILHALGAGCDTLILGIGGSATNDGGAGMARALGVRFLDASGDEIAHGGAALLDLATIDTTHLDPRARSAKFTVACDVDSPLCGPNGTAAIYGPQKGATSEDVELLDGALAHMADCIEAALGIDMRNVPGAGAAGGLGGGLMAFLDAQLRSGIELIMEAVGLAEILRAVDLVITGEGRIDSQTASGKVISGIATMARGAGIPLIALVGSCGITPEAARALGLTAAYSIVSGPMTEAEAMHRAGELLADAAETLGAILAASSRTWPASEA